MKVILVDAMNLVKRQEHTHAELASSDGDETGILHGVLHNILFFNKMFPEHAMIFAFEGGHTWRHDLSAEYKANREEHGLDEQLDSLREVFEIFGLRYLSFAGFEADDLIGMLSASFEAINEVKEILIYSSDKDFFQLITPRTKVVRRDKSESTGYSIVDIKYVIEKFGVHPKDWAKMRAYSGDKSDNLKPMPGVGDKTALKFLAAGIDPSTAKLSQRTAIIAPQLRQYWGKIHECYRLSCILRSADDENVNPKWRNELRSLIHDTVNMPYRKKFTDKEMEKRTEAFIQFATKYELIYLLSQRHHFWRIP